MKKFLALILVLIGVVFCGASLYGLLITGYTVYGYHAMYPGLAGLALLSVGLLTYQE